MPDLNQHHFMGRLTADPYVKTTPSGATITTLGVATNRRVKTPDGKWETRPTFLYLKCLGSLAAIARDHLRKGSTIFAQSRLELNQWQGKDGHQRSQLELIVEELQFLDPPAPRDYTQSTHPAAADTPDPMLDSTPDIPW